MSEAGRDDEELVVVQVPAEHAGQRMDKVLAQLTPYSRTLLQNWMIEGRITQDDEVVAQRTRAVVDAEIAIRPAPPVALNASPENIPLEIVYEDADVLIVNKPAGMVVHPALGHASGTLVNALLHHVQIEKTGDATRPGIVHRLDKDTSGLLVVAKTAQAHEKLVEQFQTHSIERRYVAVVIGVPPEKLDFVTLHGRHPHHRQKFTSHTNTGKRAVTHMIRDQVFRGACRVHCSLETGRTHQIRVHLSEAGFPVLGDTMYGRAPADPGLREIARELGRQALHAETLGFVHPTTGKVIRFSADPPADFQRALAQLESPHG